MKRLVVILIFCLISQSAYCQFDFILNKLTDIAGKFAEDPKGFVNTIEDVKQIEKAINLINDSKCAIQDYEASLDLFDNQGLGLNCIADVQVKMMRNQLENSSIRLLDALAQNAVGIGSIIKGIAGSGPTGEEKAINKTLVSNAIRDAYESIQFYKDRAEITLDKVAKKEKQEEHISAIIPTIEIAAVGISENVNSASARRAKQNLDSALGKVKGLKNVMTMFLTFILLIGTAYSIAVKPETLNAGTIVGLLSAIIVLSLVNIIWV